MQLCIPPRGTCSVGTELSWLGDTTCGLGNRPAVPVILIHALSDYPDIDYPLSDY